MPKDYLFFISHNSEDNQLAQQLYDLLLEGHPEWEDKIFLDCSGKKPLENKDEWQNAMMRAVEDSRHLIFVTSKVEHLKEGNGWLYEEVKNFQNLKATRHRHGRAHKNVSYMGILLCDCHFERDLYSDVERGSTYRTLYNAPQHLVLGENTSLQTAKERILEKVAAMIKGTEVDDVSLELLKRLQIFAEERVGRGAMLAEDAIDDALLPPILLTSDLSEEMESALTNASKARWLAETADKTKRRPSFSSKTGQMTFDGFCDLAQRSHVQLLGREGGCGKTTLMTKLFHHQLRLCAEDPNQHAIPLYVDAKSLAAPNELILRYLSMHLLGEHTAMTAAETGEGAKKLAAAFSVKRQTPRYMLLIDGYNELPESSVKRLNEELHDFLPGRRYESVRVVISGRAVELDLPESAFAKAEVQELEQESVRQYLQRKLSPAGSLLKILRIPMYLKLFADTDTHSDIRNKADLLREFLIWQERKDDASAAKEQDIAQYHILLRHMLPAIAYGMVNQNDAFVLTQDDLEALIESAADTLYSDDYRRYYGAEYRNWLKIVDYKNIDTLDLTDAAIRYYAHTAKILHQDTDHKLEFVHQVYRDFFTALYVAEEIRRALKKGVCSCTLTHKLLDGDVMEFVADLLKEKAVCFDSEAGVWDYSCNDGSCLVQMMALCRRNGQQTPAVFAANILNMLRYARRNDLSGLDLSGLDLTATKLQNCIFTRHDREKSHPTCFAGAKIHRENLLIEQHSYLLRAACTNEWYVACLDEGGFLKLWEKKINPLFPVKTITNVRGAVKKMLFSPDGGKIYAMTTHEILEIVIPDDPISRGRPRVLYRCADLLRDIALDEQGELRFSTAANAFNFKKMGDANAPDEIKFYAVHSTAAVNATADRLAYGYIAGYEGLKLLDRGEDGAWQERKFGFEVLLEAFMQDLEALFRDLGCYDYFAIGRIDPTGRRASFYSLRQGLMDRTHHFEDTPGIIAKKCIDTMKYLRAPLNAEQKEQLYALVGQHRRQFKNALDEQGELLHLNGREITGLHFHKDNKTLLISGVINYEKIYKLSKSSAGKNSSNEKAAFNPKKRFDNWVVTMDTDTFDVRVIKIQKGERASCAFYCGEDIVIINKRMLSVFDANGTEVAAIRCDTQRCDGFISIPENDTFYVFSAYHIYEIDQNMRCLRYISNYFRSAQLGYFEDGQGGKFLCELDVTKKGKVTGPRLPGPVIDLHNGRLLKFYDGPYVSIEPFGSYAVHNGKYFASRDNRVIAFCDDRKVDELSIDHILHICGCDFTGVQGTVAEPSYRQTLYRMGGKTGTVCVPQVQVLAEEELFVPSQGEFVLPEKLPAGLYPQGQNIAILDHCDFDRISESGLAEKLRQHTDPGNGLEAADYSILEWVERMGFATMDVIRDLTEAGLIVDPVGYQDTGARVMATLHRAYGLVFRSSFFADDVPVQPLLAKINLPFASKLFYYITGKKASDPMPLYPANKSASLQKIGKTLALNSWFALTVKRHRASVEDYGLNALFGVNSHFYGHARVSGYIRLGGQAFFGQAFRGFNSERPNEDLLGKVKRLCILAQYYRALECEDHQLSGVERQPILVLIGEDLEQCRQIYGHVQHIYPNVRKLFTFDSLLLSEEAAQGAGNYFEFCDGEPHSVQLETLVF